MAKRASAKLPDEGKALKDKGKKWLDRIDAAWKREDAWSKDAEAAVKAYTNESASSTEGRLYDYNILHANVETIVPAIINSPPIPDIRRRFGDDDPVARTLSQIIERAIGVQVDDSRLQNELEGQAHDSFMAGRGIIRLRFHADTVETETSALEEAQDEADDGGEGGRDQPYDDDRVSSVVEGGEDAVRALPDTAGAQAGVDQSASVTNERITFEAVSWRDYQHGPATRWEDRPWESYRHTMLAEDITDFADEKMASLQTEPGASLYGDMSGDVVVYEIWDKKSGKVCFIDDQGHYLKEIDDPLGLPNFFPSSRPVQPIEIVGRLMPVTPFSIYKKLADELDVISKRIRVLTEAMKVKGAFVGALGNDLMALAQADDNELTVISGSELVGMMQNGKLDDAITWWPVEKFQPVLAELFKNRDLTKQAIYEITGISDIVRGASKASETLGAQQIKTQWGSLRIQKMQRMMERSARDLFVMMSDLIPSKFSHETLERMTGIPIALRPTDDPETVQMKLKLHELMKQPLSTYYRIDVESNSTVRADLTMKKQEMAEFLAGSAAFFQGMAPIVAEGGPEALEGAMTIYAAATRNFDLGKTAEDAIEKLVQQAKAKAEQAKDQPPPPSPEQIKAQAEAQKTQVEAERMQVENAERQQALQSKDAEDQQKRDIALQQAEQDAMHKNRLGQLEYEQKQVQLATARVGLLTAVAKAAAPQPGPDGESMGGGIDAAEIAKIVAALTPDDRGTMERHAEVTGALNSMAEAIARLAEVQTRPRTVIAPSGKSYTAMVN